MNGVLVDTSVWIEHFRRRSEALIDLLAHDQVLMHPLVVGEIACGTPPRRTQTLADLDALQQTQQASVRETREFVERERLHAQGCGLVDMLLLASALMMPDVKLWTLDKRLQKLAERFGILYRPQAH